MRSIPLVVALTLAATLPVLRVLAQDGTRATEDTTRIGAPGSTGPRACDAGPALRFGERADGDAPLIRATGASVGVIDSAALGPMFGRTLSEALTARLPGVSVMRSSGIAGTGSRVRLRGPGGILTVQQPLLYVDGRRVEGELHSLGLDTGGQAPSRLDDIPVEDVECIYVLRGPAAAAQYGTDAAAGVIHVIMRRPVRGETGVSLDLEAGTALDGGDYPANYGSTTPGRSGTRSCTLADAAQGLCTAGTMRSWSPLDADSPFRAAPIARIGARWQALDSDRASFAVSARAAREDGVYRINDRYRYSLSAGAELRPHPSVRLGGDVLYTGGHVSLPYAGSPSLSILNSALLGSTTDDQYRRGYRALPLRGLEQFFTDQDLYRLGGGIDLSWSITPWLSFTANAGREDADVDDRRDEPHARLGVDTAYFIGGSTLFTAEQRAQRNMFGAALAASYGLGRHLRLMTAIGGEQLDETNRAFYHAVAGGDLPGFEEFRWQSGDRRVRGVFARQHVAVGDVVFLSGGVRRDDVKAIVEFDRETYPFADAAVVLRDASPERRAFLSRLRLRAAYGESGDARAYPAIFFSGAIITVPIGAPAPEVTLGIEHSEEFEWGVDLGLFSRIDIEATRFRQRTTDALYPRPLPPGTGGGGSTVANDAVWRNEGTEIALRARLLERGPVRADLAVQYTSLRNEVTDLGGRPPLVAAAGNPNQARVTPGYPLFGLWGRDYTYADANGDGVLVPSEVTAQGELRYLGSPTPTRELGVSAWLHLPNGIALWTLIDHRGGFRQSDGTAYTRCSVLCAALFDAGASLDAQARAVDRADAASAYIEKGDFVRLREVAASWKLPTGVSRRIGARSAVLTLAGKNLLTVTDYNGLDPEVADGGQASLFQREFFTLPLPRTFTIRLDTRW